MTGSGNRPFNEVFSVLKTRAKQLWTRIAGRAIEASGSEPELSRKADATRFTLLGDIQSFAHEVGLAVPEVDLSSPDPIREATREFDVEAMVNLHSRLTRQFYEQDHVRGKSTTGKHQLTPFEQTGQPRVRAIGSLLALEGLVLDPEHEDEAQQLRYEENPLPEETIAMQIRFSSEPLTGNTDQIAAYEAVGITDLAFLLDQLTREAEENGTRLPDVIYANAASPAVGVFYESLGMRPIGVSAQERHQGQYMINLTDLAERIPTAAGQSLSNLKLSRFLDVHEARISLLPDLAAVVHREEIENLTLATAQTTWRKDKFGNAGDPSLRAKMPWRQPQRLQLPTRAYKQQLLLAQAEKDKPPALTAPDAREALPDPDWIDLETFPYPERLAEQPQFELMGMAASLVTALPNVLVMAKRNSPLMYAQHLAGLLAVITNPNQTIIDALSAFTNLARAGANYYLNALNRKYSETRAGLGEVTKTAHEPYGLFIAKKLYTPKTYRDQTRNELSAFPDPELEASIRSLTAAVEDYPPVNETERMSLYAFAEASAALVAHLDERTRDTDASRSMQEVLLKTLETCEYRFLQDSGVTRLLDQNQGRIMINRRVADAIANGNDVTLSRPETNEAIRAERARRTDTFIAAIKLLTDSGSKRDVDQAAIRAAKEQLDKLWPDGEYFKPFAPYTKPQR